MKRRDFLLLITAVTIPPQMVRAQSSVNRVPRIGMLWHAANEEEEAVYLGAARRGLNDFGYVEGKNIILENRYPAENPDRFQSLAAELVALKVDILVAITRPAALAAQRATTTIPIIFVAIPDPVGSKLVASLARPGGNLTGLSNFALDLTAKRVEHLKEIVPSVSKVALLVNPNDKDGARRYIEEAQAAADRLQVALSAFEVRGPGDLESAFSKMQESKINGVVVTQDGLFFAARQEVASLALAHRLPLAVYSRETVEAGALASYGPSNLSIFRRSGYYIDKILKGAKPADLPVEQPTKFEFIVNLKTAKALDLDVPLHVQQRADEVIQ
ncbi:ABC transporter substrate-binding protein [Bradyrhizobium sp. JYMT SZCCT0428]|uniref:ABC transporter substrate-binding protein n=1 Tax=Bradyrhizobium sp. JYMT SZCCT0428 TaxID=2807673 RepID=UPI001BADD21F|nr:ABC transporter substrate-binding protein [Bradyrhizobium sp. JYMT SZCCT0428]MBR1157433.1 ABC transporter substrate-binding protein [Bradyrhizobium sp. JYMT SZCCT0428]